MLVALHYPLCGPRQQQPLRCSIPRGSPGCCGTSGAGHAPGAQEWGSQTAFVCFQGAFVSGGACAQAGVCRPAGKAIPAGLQRVVLGWVWLYLCGSLGGFVHVLLCFVCLTELALQGCEAGWLGASLWELCPRTAICMWLCVCTAVCGCVFTCKALHLHIKLYVCEYSCICGHVHIFGCMYVTASVCRAVLQLCMCSCLCGCVYMYC